MSERLEFAINKPTVFTLAFAEGRAVPSRFGNGQQLMLSSADGKVAFVPAYVGPKLAAIRAHAGMTVSITKAERAGKKGFDWTVEPVGEQQDGTFKIPKADSASPPRDAEPASCQAQPNQGTAIVPQSIAQSERVSIVESHAKRLIDLQAGLMAYAQKYGGAVSRDDVRTILISAYIQNRGVTMQRRAHR